MFISGPASINIGSPKSGKVSGGNVTISVIKPSSIRRTSSARGDLDQAIPLYEQAVTLDPLRTASHVSQGYMLYVAGRYGEAHTALQKAMDLNPQAGYVHAQLAKVLIAERKPQQALTEIDKEPIEWQRYTCQGLAYHALGREQDSNAAVAGLIAKHQNEAAYQIAEVYAFRGESDRSVAWLERAYQQRDTGLPEIKTDPLLKNLRLAQDSTNFSRNCVYRHRTLRMQVIQRKTSEGIRDN